MAVRKCSSCLTAVPPGLVLAYSDNIVCPACQAELTIWNGSRLLASIAGILAGVLVWQLTSSATSGALAWTLPVLYSFLAFGAVSALVLMVIADLRPQLVQSTALPVMVQSVPTTGGGHH